MVHSSWFIAKLPTSYFLLPTSYFLLLTSYFRFSTSHFPLPSYLCLMSEYSIQEAMQQFLEKSKLKQRVRALEIKDVWAELMGKTIANYTEDIKLVGGQLIITTSVAPLKQELIYQREKIRNRINELFNEHVVKEVIIK
jgi:chaperonin cofactor prefoldin